MPGSVQARPNISSMRKLSVVIPVFNEAGSLSQLYKKLSQTLTQISVEYEVIFIDDGSTDGSADILRTIAGGDCRVRLVEFDRNRGQHKALEIGLRESRGEIVISMDADLQNDPSDIPLLLSEIEKGHDLVCGWRSDRRDHWLKKANSAVGNYLQKNISKIDLHDMSCTMRAYRRGVISDLALSHRSEVGMIPLIISRRTKKISEIRIKHNSRYSGKSKYPKMSHAPSVIYRYLRLLRRLNSASDPAAVNSGDSV